MMVVDVNPTQVEQAGDKGAPRVYGDAAAEPVLEAPELFVYALRRSPVDALSVVPREKQFDQAFDFVVDVVAPRVVRFVNA